MIRIDIFLWGVDGVKGWGVRCTSPIQMIIDFFGGREATTENASAVRRLPNITYRKWSNLRSMAVLSSRAHENAVSLPSPAFIFLARPTKTAMLRRL